MVRWAISYSLNSAIFAPLEKAILQDISLTNKTSEPLLVTKVLLNFECQEGNTYTVKCKKTIEPKQNDSLPNIEITIPLGMPTGAQRYMAGVETKQFINNKWETEAGFAGKGKFIEIQPLKPKDFKVFISHSNSKNDKKLVESCRDALITCGLTGYFAEADNKAGLILWDKILREITYSDACLVLYTEDGSNSGDIREEIGIALGREKKIIPIVQEGIEPHGSLKSRGIEWIPYHPKKEISALSEALTIIMDLAKTKEENKAVLERFPKKKASTKTSKLPKDF